MVGGREAAEGSAGAQFARKEWFTPSLSLSPSTSSSISFRRTWRNPWTYTCMWDALGHQSFQLLRNEWVTPLPYPGGKCKSADPRTRKPFNALDLKISVQFRKVHDSNKFGNVGLCRPLWNLQVLDFYESQSLRIPGMSLKISGSIYLITWKQLWFKYMRSKISLSTFFVKSQSCTRLIWKFWLKWIALFGNAR